MPSFKEYQMMFQLNASVGGSFQSSFSTGAASVTQLQAGTTVSSAAAPHTFLQPQPQQPQQPSGGDGTTPQPGGIRVSSDTPTMGEVGLLLSGIALAGAGAGALRRRERQGKKD